MLNRMNTKPVWWEFEQQTDRLRGGVVECITGGYTAILLIRTPSGAENSIRHRVPTLEAADRWLAEQFEAER